ncbi:putative NHN endonuclease [uncultured Caudovirales phage]|uniref:Putative NHN endonuclease n=1 Tax=uncultured Caudovirales phage TaxID=2100421 RepID=A0A6J7VQH9_9CAUD|nr:putative NHN endonuclease [uncultured Caudovirales phage]
MLTVDDLRQVLNYDPATGVFTWKVTNSNRAVAGSVAGTLRVASETLVYRQIRIDGVSHRAHRLAWLYMTGEWPKDVVDHVNGNGTDNRWVNIREATKSQNQFNRRASRNNTSGRKGVVFLKDRNRWRALIWVNDQPRYLGNFYTYEAAVAARSAAERQLHGAFARAA